MMGVYSDVMITLDKHLDELFRQKADPALVELLDSADVKRESERSFRYDFTKVKWYEDDEDSIECRFHELLEKLDPAGQHYNIWKFTSEYMYDGYSPLDRWGSHYDPDLYPKFHYRWE
ncbi:hypothetical protein [Caldibacillus debilis]|nr:hypothetical protein [Caldibacillus debilis]